MWLVDVDARVTEFKKTDDWIKPGSYFCCDMILRADQRQDLEQNWKVRLDPGMKAYSAPL